MRQKTGWILCWVALSACTSGGGRGRDREEIYLPRELFIDQSKKIRDYTQALLLLEGESRKSWEEAVRQIGLLAPFFLEPDEPDLVGKALRPDREGEEARAELLKRGRTYDSILVFTGPYNPETWNAAHQKILEAGEFGSARAAMSLFQMLFNPQLQDRWGQYRHYLVATGEPARETAEALVRELADRMLDVPMENVEYLGQVIMVLVTFGEKAEETVSGLLEHSSSNVRRAAATALGGALAGAYIPRLEELLKEDDDWMVRGAAATSLGQMSALRSRTGPILREALLREKDRFLRREIVRALGENHFPGAVPVLISVLDSPDAEGDITESAMMSLWQITGERINRREDWKKWFETKYEEWKKGVESRP